MTLTSCFTNLKWGRNDRCSIVFCFIRRAALCFQHAVRFTSLVLYLNETVSYVRHATPFWWQKESFFFVYHSKCEIKRKIVLSSNPQKRIFWRMWTTFCFHWKAPGLSISRWCIIIIDSLKLHGKFNGRAVLIRKENPRSTVRSARKNLSLNIEMCRLMKSVWFTTHWLSTEISLFKLMTRSLKFGKWRKSFTKVGNDRNFCIKWSHRSLENFRPWPEKWLMIDNSTRFIMLPLISVQRINKGAMHLINFRKVKPNFAFRIAFIAFTTIVSAHHHQQQPQ